MDTKPTVEGPLTLISRKPRMYLQTPDQKKHWVGGNLGLPQGMAAWDVWRSLSCWEMSS